MLLLVLAEEARVAAQEAKVGVEGEGAGEEVMLLSPGVVDGAKRTP